MGLDAKVWCERHGLWARAQSLRVLLVILRSVPPPPGPFECLSDWPQDPKAAPQASLPVTPAVAWTKEIGGGLPNQHAGVSRRFGLVLHPSKHRGFQKIPEATLVVLD